MKLVQITVPNVPQPPLVMTTNVPSVSSKTPPPVMPVLVTVTFVPPVMSVELVPLDSSLLMDSVLPVLPTVPLVPPAPVLPLMPDMS